MKMILVVLLVALISLVTSQQGTPECTAATSALAAQADCQLAVDGITAATFTEDQFELVCNDTLECNRLYRSLIQSCSPEIPGDIVQLACAMPTANNTCAHVLLVNVTYDYLFGSFLPEVNTRCSDYITGENCTNECMEFLYGHVARFGCCWTEILAYLATITGYPEDTANTILGFYDWCGISSSFCDNRPLPGQSVCDSVRGELYNGSDCGEAVSSFITSNFNFNDLTEITTIQGCTSLFAQFGEACGSFNSTLGAYGFLIGTLDQANDPDGLPCTTHTLDLFNLYFAGSVTDQSVCIYDYARGRCSANCRQSLVDILDQYGCCLNELIRAITVLTQSEEAQDQINYALVTSELYTFCDVPSPGFCGQTSVQYSDTATNCINAANRVFGIDNTCTEGFIEIMEANSVGTVAVAAQEICVVQQCRNRLTDFVNYLAVCDGLDDNDVIQQDFEYLSQLAKDTTCKTNGSVSCLGILQQSQTAQAVASAFNSEGGTGICLSVFDLGNPVCSNECKQLLQTGDREMGCCFSEFGVAFLDDDGFNHLLMQCQLDGDRCNDIEVNSNDPCFMAREAIQDDTDCNDAFTAILNTEINVISRTMINEVNNYLKTLCSDPGCASAVSNYFTHCQSLLNADPALNEIRNNYNSFACLQSDVNAIDCYALDHSEPTVAAVNFAFERTGRCESVLESDGMCSAACRSIIDTALDYSGCCLTDIIQNSLTSNGVTTVTIEQVYAKCEIRGPDSCKADASVGTTVKGFDVLFVLLFWMIVMMLV